LKNKKEEVVNNEKNVKIRYSYFVDEQYVNLINALWTREFSTSTYLQRNVEKTEIFWKLFTCVGAIKQHHQIYLNKRAEILSKYGTHDTTSNNWIVDKSKQEEAWSDINILNDSIVELNISKINAGDMIDNDLFSPNFGGFQNMTFQSLNQLEDWVDWTSIDAWITKNKTKEE
jgi:hypothetical protein